MSRNVSAAIEAMPVPLMVLGFSAFLRAWSWPLFLISLVAAVLIFVMRRGEDRGDFEREREESIRRALENASKSD